ncbi:hypothetical protein [Cohnella abietis]|uniref:Uncharacterized protein n=1 Tax=Cohnella abietis TaxID=2507935 RepID=A0A3T1D203_9BACL|nr:hypothetical protein [Cohnella abietis]BBI32049.1 hypothetical protein KCTCHS21_14480 [Cohnella abietis]
MAVNFQGKSNAELEGVVKEIIKTLGQHGVTLGEAKKVFEIIETLLLDQPINLEL